MKKIKNIIFCFIILCVGLCFAAMSEDSENKGVLKVEEIEKNPGKYFDKECVIEGYVTKALDVPFVQHDIFKIHDGSGEIWIYTEKGPPPVRIKVRIKGTVKKLLKIPVLNIEAKYCIELKKMEFL
ncbi:MAG: hypothetical protein JSV88_15595 [Candidatus Aminicenantes bacterium]|nr:MAG: hypothetical protein JSV88_15595 [Candidatus Aminicenantes bacterium]